MKIKKIILGCALTAALTLVIMLNQNRASAQATNPVGVSCNLIVVPETHAVIDNTSLASCGNCIVYTIKAGWKPSDGIGAKYERSTVSANGTEITCKSAPLNVNTCNATAINGSANCPPPPADLLGSTGTGTGTGTSSH